MNNHIDTLSAFNQAIRDAGIETTYTVQGTGKVERFRIGKETGKSGWAVLFLDRIAAGSYGNWKTGEKHTWCSVEREHLSRADQINVTRILADAERRRTQEQARLYKQAAKKATIALTEASPATTHPYLTRKGIGAYNARIDADTLLIPVQDSGGITSYQSIAPDGSKRFYPGGRVKGCYSLIGTPDGVTYITEGWATGATIHALTGRPVVVAFNAGNLSTVALSVRSSYPKARFIVAADNDLWGVKNVGVAAAEATGLPYIVPEFKPCDTKPTDFNDLFLLEGEDTARTQLTPPEDMPETLPIVTDDVPELFTALPDTRGEKATPLATINNLREVLRRIDVTVRYNVISKEEEILIPDQAFTQDNRANASLAWIESMCARYGMPTDKVGAFLTYIADSTPYNPVATWIESKPWDGRSRLPELARTITLVSEDEDESTLEYKKTILKRWLLSAVAAAYQPEGISSQGVLVLQGDQAMGKTSWFKRLCPPALRADGVTLDLRDKDSQLNTLAFWLVELGELDATFRKSDIAQLKSFITRDKDVIRVAYAKRKSEYARRTVFFASVNSQEFLHDNTGNRRFWTLQCESINYSHRVNMQQLWAEVLHLYKQGETWSLPKDELDHLNAYNKKFEILDPIVDDVMNQYDWSTPKATWRSLTAKQILIEMGFNNPSISECMRASAIIKKLSGYNSIQTSRGRLLKLPEKQK